MSEHLSIPLARTDERTFTGDAFSGLVAAAESAFPAKIYFVRFAPGARTFWHTHSGPQIIIVTSGVCRYQLHDGAIREARAGESVRFEAGTRHWHGASQEAAMEHFAINLDCSSTDWHEEAIP